MVVPSDFYLDNKKVASKAKKCMLDLAEGKKIIDKDT